MKIITCCCGRLNRTSFPGSSRFARWRLEARKIDMFTSQARIDRKTGPDNLGRFEYLQALVTEFQDTDKQGIFFKLVPRVRCCFEVSQLP